MRANLLWDNKDGMIKGYANIDPFCDGNDGRNLGHINNLDASFDASELEELIAKDILCYFPFRERSSIIKNWASKLQVGGTLVISGTDNEELYRSVLFGKISLDEAHNLLFGTQDKETRFKKSGISILDVVGILESVGLTLITKILYGLNLFRKRVML